VRSSVSPTGTRHRDLEEFVDIEGVLFDALREESLRALQDALAKRGYPTKR
jgi:hypothetical protein